MNPALRQPSAKRFSPVRLACVLLALLPLTVAAQQANIWHLSASTQEGIPGTMRDPATPGASQSVTFYQGV